MSMQRKGGLLDLTACNFIAAFVIAFPFLMPCDKVEKPGGRTHCRFHKFFLFGKLDINSCLHFRPNFHPGTAGSQWV